MAFVGAVFVTLWPTTANLAITATTEKLEFETTPSSTIRWHFDSAEMLPRPDTLSNSVAGYLEVAPAVRVTLERVAKGPLIIVLRPGKPGLSAGFLSSEDGISRKALAPNTSLRIADLDARAIAGTSLLLAIVGNVRVGESAGSSASGVSPTLRDGKVIAIGHSLFGTDLYTASTAALNQGDVLTIGEPNTPTFGTAKIDERAGINVSFYVSAKDAKVSRPPAAGFTFGTSWFDKLKNDGTIQGFWASLIFILGLRKVFE